MENISSVHKKYYLYFSKLGKTIDKNFKFSNKEMRIFSKTMDKAVVN